MEIVRTFKPSKETPGCIVFTEDVPQGQPQVMGSAYIKKNMMPTAQRSTATATPIQVVFRLPDEPAAPTAPAKAKAK